MTCSVVTANRLDDGAVVYLAPEGRWTGCLDAALVARDDATEPLMAMAERAVADRLVVTPYLIAVEDGPKGRLASHIKERIRATGPTVRLDLGKQAGQTGSTEARHVSL
jgi:hypothetical protein